MLDEHLGDSMLTILRLDGQVMQVAATAVVTAKHNTNYASSSCRHHSAKPGITLQKCRYRVTFVRGAKSNARNRLPKRVDNIVIVQGHGA